MAIPFTHLHVHSSYSVGIGLSTPDELCAQAKRAGYESLALTDTNGTYGFVEFHQAAQRYGIKPIYGAVIYHTSIAAPGRDRFPLTTLATSREGLRNVATLVTLSAAAYESGVALSLEQLQENAADVVFMSGPRSGELSRLVLEGNLPTAADCLARLSDILGDRWFVEIQDHGRREEKVHAQRLVALAKENGVRPVLTYEVRYASVGLRDAYALMKGIRHPNREEDFFSIDEHFPERAMRSVAETERLREVYPEAYENVIGIDSRVPGDLLEGLAPVERLGSERETTRVALMQRCSDALGARFPQLLEHRREAALGRLDREVAAIGDAGLAGTFFTLHRLLSAVRDAGVALGPASAPELQSLTANLLGITSYDPYRIDESFHPMIAVPSTGPVTVELQLSSSDRERAVAALREAVVHGTVAYVPAIERITAARAVRMVSKIVPIGAKEEETIRRAIAYHSGASIHELVDRDKYVAGLSKRSPVVRELLTRASLIENLPSGFIKSRRSLAVSAEVLTDVVAHSLDSEGNDVFLHASRDALPIESVLRLDLTPIGAMQIVTDVEDRLRAERNIAYGWEYLAIHDLGVWDDIRSGDTEGVFLFEGQTLREVRAQFPLHSAEDLTNFLTLMRTRDSTLTAADRLEAFRKDKEWWHGMPLDIRAILESTRGHILYDEQVRDILVLLTALPPERALALAEGMRASDPASLAAIRSRFMRAAADNDVTMEIAVSWFERLLRHARHTTRRERVLADALLVCKLFMLKRYYPALFYSALLNTYWNNDGRSQRYLGKVRELGMMVDVDINRSEWMFVAERGKVRAGFCTLADVGADIAQRIVRVRDKQPYISLEDFVRRIGARTVTAQTVRRWVDCGVFDSLGETRTELVKRLKTLYRRPGRQQRASREGQLDLPFDA